MLRGRNQAERLPCFKMNIEHHQTDFDFHSFHMKHRVSKTEKQPSDVGNGP